MSGKPDIKNILIVILGCLVLVEAFFLFQRIQTPPVETTSRESTLPIKGRIAIIIDDWGYSTKLCSALNRISSPLTISILPDLARSKEVSRCAQAAHKEVLLHLPLEPHKNFEHYPDDYLIKTSMDSNKVALRLEEAINSVPGIVGVNNHMGSKATENSELMNTIFRHLKKKRLFFVDSMVTNLSVGGKIARENDIAFIERDIFLDNENDRAYIENQIAQLADLASKRGYAVGIGHARSLTLQVLEEQLPHLMGEGYQISTVKNLIEFANEYPRN